MTDGGRTALVVVASDAETVVAPWRRRYLQATVDRGIPAHITVLFPFVPAAALDAGLLARVRDLYAPVAPFDCALASVESFPGHAWLAPEPVERFVELIELTTRAFPDFPPYGGLEIEPVPHCTLGADDDPARLAAMVDELRAGLAAELPIRCRVDAVTLLEERHDGQWCARRSFALEGGGA